MNRNQMAFTAKAVMLKINKIPGATRTDYRNGDHIVILIGKDGKLSGASALQYSYNFIKAIILYRHRLETKKC